MKGQSPIVVRVVESVAGVAPAPQTVEERAANMARGGATDREIATALQMKRRAVRRMRKHLELERALRRIELRKKQTELALAGNEPMLRVLGEIELEQAKKDREVGRERLPDLDRYPGSGYPPGDPRTLVMENNRRVRAEELLRFARFVGAYAKENSGASWMECLKGIASACGVEISEIDLRGGEGSKTAESWEAVLGELKLGMGE